MMTFPEKIPVERMEDYHTHFVGKYQDESKFWGYEAFVFTEHPVPKEGNWQKYRREYAVLYLFDKDGTFVEAKHEYAGTTDSIKIDIEAKIWGMISEIGDTVFCSIEIKPFQVEIDGFTFGLIPNEDSGMIELQPGSTIAFGEPWDGEYWT